jgi:hypothetical protein
MSPLSTPRRTPWLAGALVLVSLAVLIAPLATHFGLRRWPFYVGLAAGAVLLLGWLERLWQRRAVTPRSPFAERRRHRGRFRVVRGGKGNGHAHDVLGDDDGDKPRWLM